jgi:hypothetical protein
MRNVEELKLTKFKKYSRMGNCDWEGPPNYDLQQRLEHNALTTGHYNL